MRLSVILFHLKKKYPNGHIYRGKYRLVKPVFPDVIEKMKNEFRIEEQNMFYLRHPYLTSDQSAGHSKALGNQQQQFGEILKEQRLRFKDNVTLADRLGHLQHGESWE